MKLLVTLSIALLFSVSAVVAADTTTTKQTPADAEKIAEIPPFFLNKDVFAQAVGICNVIKEAAEESKKNGKFKSVCVNSFLGKAPSAPCNRRCYIPCIRSGFAFIVDGDGNKTVQSLQSIWGFSSIAGHFVYEPGKDGTNPSGSYDKTLIKKLGLRNYNSDPSSKFSEPNWLYPGTYWITELDGEKIAQPLDTFSGTLPSCPYEKRTQAWEQLKQEYKKGQTTADTEEQKQDEQRVVKKAGILEQMKGVASSYDKVWGGYYNSRP